MEAKYASWLSKKLSKTKAKEFAEKMDEIEVFCNANAISFSSRKDSFYFTLNGKNYRISNHTIAKSNAGAYDEFGNQIREKYHADDEETKLICITAGKTRIIELYTALSEGKKLNKRGCVIGAE